MTVVKPKIILNANNIYMVPDLSPYNKYNSDPASIFFLSQDNIIIGVVYFIKYKYTNGGYYRINYIFPLYKEYLAFDLESIKETIKKYIKFSQANIK